VATHPGYLIKEELECLDLSKHEMAEKLGLDLSAMNALLEGNENVTPTLAMNLEKMLGIDAEYWLRMQIQFELDTLRIKHKKEFEQQNVPSQLRNNMLNFILRNVAIL
jgi:HTH-type transcriptional regulator/antitoxin HigA